MSVHVRKCPYGNRGKPTTEFEINGKPQIYCMGWVNSMNDEALPFCESCKDWYRGKQLEEDLKKAERKEEFDCNDCYYSMQNCNDISICCEDETALCDNFEPVAERKEE